MDGKHGGMSCETRLSVAIHADVAAPVSGKGAHEAKKDYMGVEND